MVQLILAIAWIVVAARDFPGWRDLGGDGSVALKGAPLYRWKLNPQQIWWNEGQETWSPQREGVGNWVVPPPSAGVIIGNEIGDWLYQEMVYGPSRANRTPLMVGWLTSPAWRDWRAQIIFEQDDLYGEKWRARRASMVELSSAGSNHWAWFGENYPGYSSLRGGIARDGNDWATRWNYGRDYFWIFGAGGAWYPLRMDRVAGEISRGAFHLRAFGEETIKPDPTRWKEGSWKEYGLHLYWEECYLQAGLAMRRGIRRGDYPWMRRHNAVLFPWVGGTWGNESVSWKGWIGAYERGVLLEDTLRWHRLFARSGQWELAARTRVGHVTDPFAPDREWDGGDTLDLEPAGIGWTQDVLMRVSRKSSFWSVDGWFIPWIQGGTLYFEPVEYSDSLARGDPGELPWEFRRRGQIDRLSEIIGGWKNGASVSATYRELYGITVGAVRERRWDHRITDIQGPRWVLWGTTSWRLLHGLQIGHTLQWRSAIFWNHWGLRPLRVPEQWVWNASIRQEFAREKLILEAVWTHLLSANRVEMPLGNEHRESFAAQIRKEF